MGKRGGYKNRSKGARKGTPGGYAAKDRPHDSDGYKEIPRENEKMLNYFKLQKFFATDEEFEAFAAKLKSPLPSTFRITGMRDTAALFRDMMEKRYISELQEIEVDGVKNAPIPVDFYPNRLAWTFDVARHSIRKEPRLKRFKQFLVAMNEKGNLSRQEAVSMIPPLLLDVKPEHKVLDMCAAPGSKTAQLIEKLHGDSAIQPTGLVIANDSDNKRCYILTKQTKRLQSPNFMVTNLDASRFPTIKLPSKEDPSTLVPLKFDRILCDVPCSGDGTIRKNPKVWQNWNQMVAVGLHKLQIRIAYRGAQLLDVGGRLVYSTCSFNPIENEAVVAAILRSCKGALKLVETKDMLPLLKRTPGLHTWTVAEKFGRVLPDHAEIEPQLKKQFVNSMWPPSAEEAESMYLDRCVRVFPHQQNTGGFFIAVFEKLAELSPKDVQQKPQNEKSSSSESAEGHAEKPEAKSVSSNSANSDSTATTTAPTEAQPSQKPKSQHGYKEDPFIFNDLSDTTSYWPAIKEFYGFDDSFPAQDLVTRTEGPSKRHIYFVSESVREILAHNQTDNLRIINCGVKVLTRSDAKNKPCDFRLCMDGLFSTFPFLQQSNKRLARCTIGDLILAIREEGAKIQQFSQSLQDNLNKIDVGCMVLFYEPDPENDPSDVTCPLQVLVWKAAAHVRTLVSKDDRMFFDILLDTETKSSVTAPTAEDAANATKRAAESISSEPDSKKPKIEQEEQPE